MSKKRKKFRATVYSTDPRPRREVLHREDNAGRRFWHEEGIVRTPEGIVLYRIWRSETRGSTTLEYIDLRTEREYQAFIYTDLGPNQLIWAADRFVLAVALDKIVGGGQEVEI